MGDATVVPATLDRLMREGSTGSVLLKIVFDVATGTDDHDADINSEYGRKLGLTAASWRSNRVKR
jgi:hypothetical protein